MDEVRGGWRKMHDEELRNLYSSPVVIVMAKSRKTRWLWHEELLEEIQNAYRILV
jgi:hypothetical protein